MTTTREPLVLSPRRDRLPQYSARRVLGLWAAATAPMSVLGWLVAPQLARVLGSRDPFIDALLLCFNLGGLWQVALVLLVVRRERGSLTRAHVADALWLRRPQDPRTGRVGGRVWLWVPPFLAGAAAFNFLPLDPVGPLPRDFPAAALTDRVHDYFQGNWWGFGQLVLVAVLSPVAEELFFRGLLLPRMRGVFGRFDVVANGALFALYHVHQPWCMPSSLLDGTLDQALPTRLFRSTWMGIVTHSAPSLVTVSAVLLLVLA
ncbi:CPBP family intramembrane glutamic endopeptidase [Geodermatophilus sp. URMC 63]